MELIERAHCTHGVDQRNDHKWLAHSTEALHKLWTQHDKGIPHQYQAEFRHGAALPCLHVLSYLQFGDWLAKARSQQHAPKQQNSETSEIDSDRGECHCYEMIGKHTFQLLPKRYGQSAGGEKGITGIALKNQGQVTY